MFNTLLADDNSSFRHSLKAILARHFPFMLISEACNGGKAIAFGVKYRPHLVFMDIKLPDRSGLEVARQFKAAHPAAEVCIVTQYDIPEYRIAAQECGADHFIAKYESSEAAIVAMVEYSLSRRFLVLLLNHAGSLRNRIQDLLLHHWPDMLVIEATGKTSKLAGCPVLKPDVVITSELLGAGWHRKLEEIKRSYPKAKILLVTNPPRFKESSPPPPPGIVVLHHSNDEFGECLLAIMGDILAVRSLAA